MMNLPRSMSRILLCSTALTFGGEQKQIALILRHLDRKRFDPTLCCIRSFGYLDEAIRSLHVPLVCLGLESKYDLLGAIRGLRRVIKENHIDLMHVSIFGSQFPGLLAAMSARIPVVAVLESTFDLATRSQSVGSMSIAWQYKWRSIYAGLALIARVARIQFVALSEAVRQSAVQHLHLPPEKIIVIPLGLAPAEFDGTLLPIEASKKIRYELGLNGAYPVLLNVARLLPLKGQKDLLRIMPLVLERFPRAKLLIAGDGPLMEELAQMRDGLGLQQHVLLLGRRDDIAALLHASDIFVFASYYEGLPGAVIEAMSARKPVAAFDIPSLREVVQDGRSGVLLEGRNIEGFAKAIIQLADNREEALGMGVRAQRFVQQKFDIRQNVKNLEGLYEKMLAQTR